MMKKHSIKQNTERAQGMVEFALILPLLLMLVLGIVEIGRLLFFYSSIASASREGARYGSAVGQVGDVSRYEDCEGIQAAALKAGAFAGLGLDNISIQYDDGTTLKDASCPPSETIRLADRVVVTVTGNFRPVVPLLDVFFPDDGLDITSTTARTIIKQVGVKGTPVPTSTPPEGGGPPPTATFTSTPTDTPTATPTASPTATATATATPTATSTGTPPPTATNTPVPANTDTPTPTPACPSPGGIISASKKVKFAITNPSPDQTYTITGIHLSWSAWAPELKSITFSTFTDNITPAAPPPNYSVDPGWTGTFADQEVMIFTFQNNLEGGQTFSIAIDFVGSGGCTSSVSGEHYFSE